MRQDYTVADQDLAVSYTDGSTEEGGEWGAGPFGGSGSLTVSEAFVGGEFYLTGTFTFELVPTSGDLVGVTKSLKGTFENLWITYDQKSC